MHSSELWDKMEEHYRQEELDHSQWQEASTENLYAFMEIRDFMTDFFPGTAGVPIINLGEVYYHPEIGPVRAAAIPIAWKRKFNGRLSRLHIGAYKHSTHRYNPSRADVITVEFVLLEGESEPTLGSEVFAREYYGLHKGLEIGIAAEAEEIYFDNNEEAIAVAKERRQAVTPTVNLLRKAATDSELNPELASRLAAA